jgi:lipopolysaccharide assembly protein A
MRYIKYLLFLFFFVATMTLFAQNMDTLKTPAPLGMTVGSEVLFLMEYPLYFLFLAAFFIGGFITVLFFFMERVRLAGELKRARVRMATLEQEVNSLRNLPLDRGPAFSPASSPAGEAGSAQSEG